MPGHDPWHYPVLHQQLVPLMARYCPRGWLVDATVGMGGHSQLLLAHCPELRVLAIDADREMLELARRRLVSWGSRVRFWHGWFDDFFGAKENRELVANQDVTGVLLDFGVSQAHYQRGGRGFALNADEEPDMRLDPSSGRSAGELVRHCSAEQLEKLFRDWGEERFARAIARRIVAERQRRPLRSCRQLAETIASAVPPPQRYRSGNHPATRCFQALRIAVNDEVERLRRVLPLSFDWLTEGGVLACVSFHSLEDRPVKQFFLARQQAGEGRLLHRKPLRATEDELADNRASRSARLRLLLKGDGRVVA